MEGYYFSIAIPRRPLASYLHTSYRTGNLTSALLSCFSMASKNWLRNWLHFSIYLHICFAREGCSNDSTMSVLTAYWHMLTPKYLNQRRVSIRQTAWSRGFATSCLSTTLVTVGIFSTLIITCLIHKMKIMHLFYPPFLVSCNIWLASVKRAFFMGTQ